MKTLTLTLGAAAIFGLTAITPTFGQMTPVGTTTTTTTTGTVSDFGPNMIAVRVAPSAAPVHYTFTKTTTYVDENGNPVSVQTVRSGEPVEVFYEKNGDTLVADKVVVKKTVSTTDAAPAMVESQPVPPSADGFITSADSDFISIRNASGTRGHYQAHDSTAYVDENGNPVSKSSLRDGTPVTIFYERDGDSLRATRVVVKNSGVIEKTTTTQETVVPQ